MSFDFYRKERPATFTERFSAPSDALNAWSLTSHLIFQAKNAAGKKNFKVKVNNQDMFLEATVTGNELLVKKQPNLAGPSTPLRLSEANMADALANKNEGSILYQIAKKLCKDHATSSASSPLISGCITDNFEASKTYPGAKLHLKLRFRQPFQNPFVSGLEKEYFLIGQVLDTDCESIIYMGNVDQNISALVNPYGSKIPRPVTA